MFNTAVTAMTGIGARDASKKETREHRHLEEEGVTRSGSTGAQNDCSGETVDGMRHLQFLPLMYLYLAGSRQIGSRDPTVLLLGGQ